jgi:replicative DNA helicase
MPPNNIELEQSIIRACLYDPDDIYFEQVQPEDFYKTAHQKIFEACCELKQRQDPIDIVSVSEVLRKKDEYEAIGGATYLNELLEAWMVIKPEFSIGQLLNYSGSRKMLQISNAVQKRCFSGDTIEEIVDYCQGEILKIGNVKFKNGFRKLTSIVADAVDRCELIASKSGVTGVPSGYEDIDRLTCGFQNTDFILLAARPRMGKTAFMSNCIANAAAGGFKSAMISLEMAGIPIVNRFLASEGGINSLKFLSGNFDTEDWHKIHGAAGKMHEWPVWIDDSPSANYKDIQRKLRTAKSQYGIDIAWIDYLGFIEGEKGEGVVREIQTISRGLKATAKELEIPIVLICQLNRECEKRADKRPALADLRDSGALEQDSDMVLFLYRDEVYNPDGPNAGIAEVEIAKYRNGPSAVRVKLAWLPKFTRFENIYMK